MKREYLAVIIVLLFIGTSLIPSALSEQTHGKTIITVDDEPGDADYISIKEALNHSSPDDIIEVFSGTYKEHGLNITNRDISLIGIPHELGNGSDTGKPFINGQGLDDVIHAKAPNVTITGFHIENRGQGYWCIIIADIQADGCVISNNTLCYSENSIIGINSNYSKIINNTIKYADSNYGICLSPYSYNLVSDNIVDHCPIGISIVDGTYDNILGNRISNCSTFGIDIAGHRNTCQFNTIENNSLGVHIYASVLNHIKQNNFINNKVQAGFSQSLGFTGGNRWSQNYWERPRKLPYPIVGTVFMFMPWVQFDWRPAIKPYDIPGMT